MFSKNSVKPLELVVSAIHCLGEKKGSSSQNIIRFLTGKYNVDTETIKTHVQTGLKRGMNFGLITQQSGFYRLNNILSNPECLNFRKIRKSHKNKLLKRRKSVRKRKLTQTIGKKGKRRFFKSAPSEQQKNRRKIRKLKKPGRPSRRKQNDRKKRKQKRQKPRGKKFNQEVEKEKKVGNGTEQTNPDVGEGERLEKSKDSEAVKAIEKT